MNTESDYKPEFIINEKVEDFLAGHQGVVVVEAFERQLKELFFIDNPAFIGVPKAEAYAGADFAKYIDKKAGDFGYIYYPWNNHLVKCVNADDYYRLKTNRNQDLITAQEQEVLKHFRLAVFGMSVGSNIAFVATQAGISNKIYLADFDELDTTNLNRILAGVHQIGLNKTIVAARRIYEDNPYAEVQIFQDGINTENLEALLKNKDIDCIVEEIDSLPTKIEIRKLALQYKVPVVMITDNGDRVVLSIERYDLGHDKIFHELPAYWENIFSGPVDKEMFGRIVNDNIVGGIDKLDPKMLASVKRVMAKELISWSQLGSAALLGGVMATFAIKKIALKETTQLNVREYIAPPSL